MFLFCFVLFWITWFSFLGLSLEQSFYLWLLVLWQTEKAKGHWSLCTHIHTQSHKIINQNNSFSSNLRSVQVCFPCRRLYSASFSVALMIYICSAHPIPVSVHRWDGTTKWRHSHSPTDLLHPTSVACSLEMFPRRNGWGFVTPISFPLAPISWKSNRIRLLRE